MEKINKIIDSLSPVEQLIMCNALQKSLIEVLSILLGRMELDIPLNLMINMRMPIMELYAILFLKLLKWLVQLMLFI